MDFLAGNLPLILCGLVGFGLLLAEAFMPGFGIAGFLGIVLEAAAIYSAWISHGPVFALIVTVIIIAVISVSVYLSYRSALKGRLSRSDLVLKDEEKAEADSETKSLMAYQNREGVTVTALRPGGTIEIDGVRLNAASGGELVEKGARVRVLGAKGDHVIVRPMKDM